MTDRPTADKSQEALIGFTTSLALGDYNASLPNESPLHEGLNRLAELFRTRTLSELDRTVNVSILANESSMQVGKTLCDLQDLALRANTIAAAAEEMVASVREIGQNGERIATRAQDTDQATAHGAQAVQQAQESMRNITQAVSNTVTRVHSLNEFTAKITHIAESIKKIASQTNLLALNATIEAARAGEAGKGFAVVAGEVKNLSGQTTAATTQIDDLVRNLQVEMGAITETMNASHQAVLAGQNVIEQVGRYMEDIRSKSQEVTESTGQITQILAQQASAASEVASGITDVSARVREDTLSVEAVVTSMASIEKTLGEAVTEIEKMNIPNKVIKLAKSDHVKWKKRLVDMMRGKEKLQPEGMADHHQCRLGKWYDAVQDPAFVNDPTFRALLDPHRLVHEHGKRAVQYFNEGKTQQALQEISVVETSSRDVLRLLEDLDRKKRP